MLLNLMNGPTGLDTALHIIHLRHQAFGLWDLQQLGQFRPLGVHQLLGGDARGHLCVYMQGVYGDGKTSWRSRGP